MIMAKSGSTHGVFNLASIPLFLVGDVIVSKLGHERALLTSLLLFSVRMLGYEFLEWVIFQISWSDDVYEYGTPVLIHFQSNSVLEDQN